MNGGSYMAHPGWRASDTSIEFGSICWPENVYHTPAWLLASNGVSMLSHRSFHVFFSFLLQYHFSSLFFEQNQKFKNDKELYRLRRKNKLQYLMKLLRCGAFRATWAGRVAARGSQSNCYIHRTRSKAVQTLQWGKFVKCSSQSLDQLVLRN